ncbi:RTA1 like protein-domain-containing protein [Aspergillus germanicus]
MGTSGYYPYEPNSAGAIIAMLCFGGSAIAHLWQMVRTRTWFFTAFLIGAFMMTLGYIFRLISARKPDSLVAYICQSMFIILPPSLYAATIYMIYGRIVVCTGKPHLSIVGPAKVTKIFVTGDVSAFLLQLAGGGMQTINSMRNMGQKILVVGLVVQLIFFAFFLVVSGTFQMRLRRAGVNLVDAQWRRLLHILFLVSSLVIARCVFRIIEYVQGTDGYLYSHEIYMYIFDTIPMFFVQAVFHFYHPGKTLVGGKAAAANEEYINLQYA